MESNKLLLSLVLFFSSWVLAGFSQGLGRLSSDASPCLNKLLPCQPYLHNPSSPPPSCCLPLEEMITDDAKCLCGIFDNPELLKSLNLTQEDALKLPKSCGLKVDTNVCKKATEPPTSSPGTPATPSNGSSGNSTSGQTEKSSACGISLFSGFGFITIFSSLVMSAF